MYIDKDTQQEILSRATLEESLQKYCQAARGRNKYVCPMCGKTMEYHPGKKLVKCFHCDWGTNSAVKLLEDTTKCSFPEALERLAADFGVVIPEKKYQAKKPKAAAKAEAWYKQQLAASGLTPADVRAWQYEADGTRMQVMPFAQGTVGPYETTTDQGDDMLIRYLDLDGHRLQYTPTLKNGRSGEPRDYFRVRWQIPESHMLRDGSICKYKSPAGSGVQLYIPERLREAYRERRKLDTLYFTEGEKKAEAVSKYVGPAFGLAGINCLVGKDKQLPEAIVRVVEACQVQKVYFIMDADWDELSKNLDPESDIRQRPQAFFSAARNFGAWFATLRNRKLFVDAYLVLGKGEQKGVDDQLAALKGAEYQYGDQIKKATSAAIEGGHTDYFDLYNITTMPEAKLQAVWHLDSIESFVGHHRKRLQEMESFRAWRNQWRLDEGGHLQLAQPLADDEQFWEVKKRKSRYGEEFEEYTFDYVNIHNFLERRGFFQIKEGTTGDRIFIHVEKNRITPTTAADIKDTVLDFARTLNNKPLLAMLYRGSTQYLGPDKLGNMSTQSFTPNLPTPEADSQLLFFRSKFWRVTADGIEENDFSALECNYRREWCMPFDPKRLQQRLVTVEHTDEGYHIKISPDGEQCDFLRFLVLASWFGWENQLNSDRKVKPGMSTTIMDYDTYLHLLSKMTAIGYLLHQYYNPGVTKAVIAMDNSISEVGLSMGRSGKSLIGKAIQQMQPTAFFSGKTIDIADDRFVWDTVEPGTRTLFIDDVMPNFDFELLFPLITDSITVNRKGRDRYTLSGHDKPKFYITTNHVVGRENGSTRDRQFKIAFSNYFDANYKPEMEFGGQFFSDSWDERQWSLFYNLMAECLVLYFEAQRGHWGVGGSGLIEAPSRNLELRQMRQEMTETFFNWMNDWMQINEDNPHDTSSGARFDIAFVRSEMMESYKQACSTRERNYVTPQRFWQRLTLWCRYHGLALNPQVPLDADGRPGHHKANGTEYVTIGTSRV